MSLFPIKKAKLICVAFIFSNLLYINAQEYEEIAGRINALESLTDANKKHNELISISSRLKDLQLSDIEQILKTGIVAPLNIIKSEDQELAIVVFGSTTYSGVYQLEWLVNYKQRIWSFSDEIYYNINKEAPVLSYNVDISDTGLYGFEINNRKQSIFRANDLVTKCLFEDLQTLKTNAAKDSLNEIIQNRLLVLWADAKLYENSFQQLKRMKTLHSEDGKVKICTYNVQKEDFKHQFYGAVIVNDNGIKVNLLNDETDGIRSPERSSLTNKKWYGALYLDLIETVASNKTYYTLLGYKGHDEFTKTRVLDVLSVQNGRLRFGSPIFKTDRITRNRVVYRYSSGATMMMRYDTKQKMIVLDNLAPSDPMFRGVYQYYGPDFSYNSFKFTKGIWELKKDIDLRNLKK